MAKKGHGHHGGAWKVAYADFVTAMMALFLVLWLTSQDEKIKEAVERSFRNPFMSVTKDSTGILPNKDTQALKNNSGNFDSASMVELNMLRKMYQDFQTLFQGSPENGDDPGLALEMTPEGMRINVFDKAQRPIFQRDSPSFTQYGEFVFTTLAWEISRYTNTFGVELEGHTEKGRANTAATYSNWELTADRANSARRKLVEFGVAESQIRKIAGFSDTVPMTDLTPTDERNRRVTVLLKIRSKLKS